MSIFIFILTFYFHLLLSPFAWIADPVRIGLHVHARLESDIAKCLDGGLRPAFA
jgi:hypothetical protein